MMTKEFLKCPICGKNVKNVLAHMLTHDPQIKNKQIFLEKFPDWEGPLQIMPEKPIVECPYCHKSFKGINILQNHIKIKHPEKFIKIDKSINSRIIECPICREMVNDLRQHVRKKHDFEWEEFCRAYDWDIKNARYFSDEYREKLSKNKIKFYKTKNGKKLRKIQSDKWKEHNPMEDKDMLEKSMYNRFINNNFKTLGERGIKFITNEYTFRSYNEFAFYTICKYNKIPLEFEPSRFTVKWFNEEKQFITSYLPDFYNPQFGLIELKSNKNDYNISIRKEKYIKVSEIYKSKNIKYNILSLEMALHYFDIKYDINIIREEIDNLINNNNLTIISPYKSSEILKKIFRKDLDKYSKIIQTNK